MKSVHQSSNHQPGKSSTTLKSLLDQKSHNKSKTSLNSPNRDISHLTDLSKRFQRQLEEKQVSAQKLLEEFILQKQSQKRQITSPQITPFRVDDEVMDVLQILETFQDINFNSVNSDLSMGIDMQRLSSNLEQSAQKGSFDLTPCKSVRGKLRSEMKANNNHFFSTEPPGRADAVNLKKWLSEQLLLVKRQPINQKQKLTYAGDLLFICLNELIRQVSYTCLERGQLMMAIFKGYLKTFRKSMKMSENDQASLKMVNYKLELELKLEFEKIIDLKDEEIRKMSNYNRDLQKSIKALNLEIDNLVAQNKQFQKQLDWDKQIKIQATHLIHNQNREIKELRDKLQKTKQMQSSLNKLPVQSLVEIEEDENQLTLSQLLREVDKKTYVEENPDIVIKDVVEEVPVITYSVATQIEEFKQLHAEVQCNLNLLDANYDKIMTMPEIDNYMKEYELKEQLATYDEGHSIQAKSSLFKILDSLPGNMDQVQNLSKNDMFNLFQKNIRLIKQVLDKDDLSDTESVLENDIPNDPMQASDRGVRSSKELTMTMSRDSIQLAPIQKIKEVEASEEQSPIMKLQRKNTFSKLTHSEQIQLRTQVQMLIMLYNMQVQKNHNATKQLNESGELLNQIFQYARKLLTQLVKQQKGSHRQIVEEMMFEFEQMRKKIPTQIETHAFKEEEVLQEEEEEKEKRRQMTFRKKKGRITKALQFNFTQKVQKTSLMDKLMHPGIILTQKSKEQAYSLKKTISYLPIKNVLKTITQIYDERIRTSKDNPAVKDLEMQIFLFNNFLNRYGFKNVAEKKFVQFLVTVIHFSSIFRVNVFARIVCLLQEDQMNYTVEETQFFLQGLEFMGTESALGSNVIQSESEQKYHVPYLRALDYLKVHLENKLYDEEIKELRIDIENLKEPDPKNQNKAGIVDVDILMVKVIAKYRIITQRTKQFVIHAFQAADLDGNRKINHNEFITLFRHIEPTKFNFKAAMQLFDEQADLLDGDEKNLSFNRFTSLCVNQQIFTEPALNHFISIKSNDELEKQFEIIKNDWHTYKADITKTLNELQPFVTPEIYIDWTKILQILDARVQSKSSDSKPVLIAHKILKLELERLLHISLQDDDIDDID